MKSDPSVERNAVDTHRHPFTPKLVKIMGENGLFDPSRPFPQAGAGDIIS